MTCEHPACPAVATVRVWPRYDEPLALCLAHGEWVAAAIAHRSGDPTLWDRWRADTGLAPRPLPTLAALANWVLMCRVLGGTITH